MARPAHKEPTRRTHLLLFESDLQRIEQLYGHRLGLSGAVRAIIRRALREIDKGAHKQVQVAPNSEVADLAAEIE